MPKGDGDKNAKFKARQGLIKDVDPGELAALAGEVAHKAWQNVSIMKAHQHKNYISHNGPDANVPFSWLSIRQKQRAMSDWMLAISATHAMRCAYAEAALQDPMTHMKIVVSLMPKELEVQVNGQVGIVVLPAKMGSTKQWVEVATGEKEVKGEILDAESVTAAETWRRMQEGGADGGDLQPTP